MLNINKCGAICFVDINAFVYRNVYVQFSK